MSDVKFVRFKARHLDEFKAQAAQATEALLASPENTRALEHSPFAFSALYEGRCIGAGGVVEYWDGLGEAWALIGPVPPHCWTSITREVNRVMEEAMADGYRRLELHIIDGFEEGHRWARLLGFDRVDHPLRRWGPNDFTYWLYERVRQD